MTSEWKPEFETEIEPQDWESIARGLQSEVDAGSPDAFWRLAELYEDGRGVERDLKRAFELRAKGAELGEPNAIVALGYSYEYAVGVPYDLPKSRYLYEKALETASEFELRGFANCQIAIRAVFCVARSATLRETTFEGQPSIETTIETDSDEDQERVQEIFSACDPEDSPFFCADLAEFLRENGSPKELCEQVAYGLDRSAAEIWRTRAVRGNGVAAGRLGEAYGLGLGVDPDEEKAISLSKIAADCGFPPSQVAVGYALELNNEKKEALAYYRAAAELDYPDGLCKAGLLEQAFGDKEKSLAYLQRGAELGHAPSLFFIGSRLLEQGGESGSVEEVKDYWRRSAEMGFPVAQERYANYLELQTSPDAPKEEWAKIADLYRSAMEQGFDTAKASYARLLNAGLGVDQDVWQAAKLFNEIAESGSAEAKELLAAMKLGSDGCDYDPIGAQELLEDAAEELPSAQVALGYRYFVGDGTPVDYRRAAVFFGRAASKYDPIAMMNFARCCLEGFGVLRNDLAGEYFIRLAAGLGEPTAAYRLGEMFADGDKVPQNWRLAAEWYQIASSKEDPDATRRLARLYWEGVGVPRDRVLATALWELAFEWGVDDALEELSRFKGADLVFRAFSDVGPFENVERAQALAAGMEAWHEICKQDRSNPPGRADFVRQYKSLGAEYDRGDKRPSAARRSKNDDSDPERRLLSIYQECARIDDRPWVESLADE